MENLEFREALEKFKSVFEELVRSNSSYKKSVEFILAQFSDNMRGLEKTIEYLEKRVENLRKSITLSVMNEIYDKLKADIYEELKVEFIAKQTQDKAANSKDEKSRDMSVLHDMHDSISHIHKIDTDKIRQKIAEAINVKGSRSAVPSHDVEEERFSVVGDAHALNPDLKDVAPEEDQEEHLKTLKINRKGGGEGGGKKKSLPLELISQANEGEYTLPCFFDGEKIFGVYNPKCTADSFKALNDNLPVLHVWPLCKEIDTKESLAMTEGQECKISCQAQGETKATTKTLPLCKACLEGVYQQKKISKTFGEFIDDILTGAV